MRNILIAPSVLSADFSNIKDAIFDIEKSGSDWVHLDVMDGSFVPNITFGPKFINDIRKYTDIVFDTHLMIDHPEKYIKNFADAGSNYITIHVEACKNIIPTLKLIKSYGCKCGLAINPETDISEILPYLDEIDLVLVMTVHPGFGGQSFIFDCLDKIKTLVEVKGSRNYLISVDGGINQDTVSYVKEAGIDVIVSGSAFFKAQDKVDFVKLLKEHV